MKRALTVLMLVFFVDVAHADDAFKCPLPTASNATCNADGVCCTKWVIDLKDGGRGMGMIVGKTEGEAVKKLEDAKAFEQRWCRWGSAPYPCGAYSRALEAADEPHCPNALNSANAPRDPGSQAFDNETRSAIAEAKRLIAAPVIAVASRWQHDMAGTSSIAVGKTFGEYANRISDAAAKVDALRQGLENFEQCAWRNDEDGLKGAIDDLRRDIGAVQRAQGALEAGYGKLPIADKIKAPLPGASTGIDEAVPLPDGGALVKIHELWGRVDKKGTFVLKPIYELIEPDADGKIRVQVGEALGTVDSHGTFVPEKSIVPSATMSGGGGGSVGGLPQGKWWQNGHDACPAGTLLRGVPPNAERGGGRYSCSLNEVCGVKEFPDSGGSYVVQCTGFTDYRARGGSGTSVTDEADASGRRDTGIGNNVAHGPFQSFYASGKPACSAMFDHGNVVVTRCLDESGKVTTTPQPHVVWITGKAAVPTAAEKQAEARQQAADREAAKKQLAEWRKEEARRKQQVKVETIEECAGTAKDDKWHWYSCGKDPSPYPFTAGCAASMKGAADACKAHCSSQCSTHQGSAMPAL